jgi:hypothetical protein
LANLLLCQAEKLLETLAPLGDQFGTVHQDRCRRRALGDHGAGHDRLAGARRGDEYSGVKCEERIDRMLLLISELRRKGQL